MGQMGTKKQGTHLGALQKTTVVLFAELDRWTAESLRGRVAVGTWSALEVVEHLVMTERAVLKAMVENLGRGGRQIRVADRWKSALVLGIMLAPTRVRIPTAVKYLEPSGTWSELSDLRNE